jgi:hypothetical protein
MHSPHDDDVDAAAAIVVNEAMSTNKKFIVGVVAVFVVLQTSQLAAAHTSFSVHTRREKSRRTPRG